MFSSSSPPAATEVDVEAAGAEAPKLNPPLEAGVVLLGAVTLPNEKPPVAGVEEAAGAAGLGRAPNENAGVDFSSAPEDLAEKSELPPPPNEKPPEAGFAGSSSFLEIPPNEKPLLAGVFAGSSFFLAPALLPSNEKGELDGAGKELMTAAGAGVAPKENGAGAARLASLIATGFVAACLVAISPAYFK